MSFSFEPTPLPGVTLVVPERFQDERGWFEESFKASEFAQAGLPATFLQDNFSFSSKGTLRGLHFQGGAHAQGKLIRVLAGACWDVAVDLRPGSSTLGRWFGIELSAKNRLQLYLEPGFAHGLVALADDTLVHYQCTAEYCAESEGGVLWNDPDLAIEWPIQPTNISAKDRQLPRLADRLK